MKAFIFAVGVSVGLVLAPGGIGNADDPSGGKVVHKMFQEYGALSRLKMVGAFWVAPEKAKSAKIVYYVHPKTPADYVFAYNYLKSGGFVGVYKPDKKQYEIISGPKALGMGFIDVSSEGVFVSELKKKQEITGWKIGIAFDPKDWEGESPQALHFKKLGDYQTIISWGEMAK